MNNVSKTFAHGKAFIPFITCGDPDFATSEKLILSMAEAGADLIELGIPFSDPTAEGPVIMAANERALKGGATADKVFDLVQRVRAKTSVPLAFMTYANVVFSRGIDNFVSRMAKLEMDALILPDVPYEEREEFDATCKKYGIDLILLVAPTSAERAEKIGKAASGFVYCVSSLGVTGERAQLSDEVGGLIKQIKSVKNVPCAIGFGISTPEQAAAMAKISDGVIVGSAIVKIIAKYGENCVPFVTDFVKSMKKAVSEV